MIIYTQGHSYLYECEKICRIFFPLEKIIFSDTLPDGSAATEIDSSATEKGSSATENGNCATETGSTERGASSCPGGALHSSAHEGDGVSSHPENGSPAGAGSSESPSVRRIFTAERQNGDETEYFCRAEIDGKTAENGFCVPPHSPDKGIPDGEKQLAKAMVRVLSEITGTVPPWGILTGVRPSKLMRRLAEKTGDENARSLFVNEYLVSPEKASLALSVASVQKRAVSLNTPDSFSLYISVPFCPTRCSYCSFVSHSIASAKKLIPEYIRLLCREIEMCAEMAKDSGLHLETVYIGGGTPTSFTAEELKTVTDALTRSFDMRSVREFTVEAGRPDTVDREKLVVLKNAGVTRVSINPQTFSDEVLKNIGRPHTGNDAVEKYLLAREVGFDSINMDFIAGLPGDTYESFKASIEKAVELSPDNITVHTLALKRSANIVTEHETENVCRDTVRMTDFSQQLLTKEGFLPYYMYRQSKSIGNLENIGWCKPDKECLYNIYMMEELHSVVACGGGAVTKLVTPGGERVERIYNFKYPYEYINRFDEQIGRKQKSGLRI